MQVGATFTGEDEPQESISRATFSSTVQPYLVDGKAILSTDGTAVLKNWTAVLFINGTTFRSLKVKQYYG